MTLVETFNAATQQHQAGDLAGAAARYQQVLSAQPAHGESLYRLAMIALQFGQVNEAIELLSRAVVATPESAGYRLNLGAALDSVGRLDEAIDAYRATLALKSDSVQALSNLGNALRRKNRATEAVAVLRRALALTPDYFEAHHNLGLALNAVGDMDGSIAALSQAAVIRPNSPDLLTDLGNMLHGASRFDPAIAVFRRALAMQPIYAQAWLGLAGALTETGELDGAAAACRQAIALKPDNAVAYNSLGKILQQQRHLSDAVACYRQALALQRDNCDFYNNLGAALYAQGDLSSAIAAYQQAIALKPSSAEAHNNLGSALKHTGEYGLATVEFTLALKLRPDYPAAHWNLGLIHLATGDFEKGWPEYEWRGRARELGKPPRQFQRPRWTGQPLNGTRVFLHAEQGLGDAIQFLRYVPNVAQRGGTIVLGCPADLAALLIHRQGIEVVPGSDATADFAIHCPLLSLPHVLQTNLQTIPVDIPYLAAPAVKTEKWRKRLNDHAGMKIGLVWAGNPLHVNDRNRSMSLATLAPLGSVKGIQFICLQKGVAREAPPMEMIDWTDDLADFTDTAALVANLDLVISVDTAVAHLAGAMGKQVWLMLPFVPDWRWMLNRTDSPWYPTMRLFRQESVRDWEKPIRDVCELLVAGC